MGVGKDAENSRLDLPNKCVVRAVLYRCSPRYGDQLMKARTFPNGGDTPAGTALRLFTAYATTSTRTNDSEIAGVLCGSREQGAGSRERGAGSGEQGAGSREQGAGGVPAQRVGEQDIRR